MQELNTKITKGKGDHEQDLLKAKIESNALKNEVIKLKAQVNVKDDKKIINLKAKVASTKMEFDNINNDNIVMHQIIKNL